MNEFDELGEYWSRRVEIGRLPLPIEGEQDVALIWLSVPKISSGLEIVVVREIISHSAPSSGSSSF